MEFAFRIQLAFVLSSVGFVHSKVHKLNFRKFCFSAVYQQNNKSDDQPN